MILRCSHASFGAPGSMGPIGKNTTVESIFKEAIRHMENAANNAKDFFKNLKISIVGKVKLGFIEITVVPLPIVC